MHIFITGGAGFIGCNSADHFLRKGSTVTVYDNLSRPGSKSNLAWLRERHGSAINFIDGDVRDFKKLASSLKGVDAVIHLAGQVAVTTSVDNPREDFEINAVGTLNVLEAVRLNCPEVPLLNASTNKVYGGMEGVRVVEEETRYTFEDFIHGIPENFTLDFHSPYGCSKGAADQYTIDYARIYGLNSVTMRQSCIYGTRQFGVEDQGWVAHFVIAACSERPITIYGDGKQLRDLLNISDLVRAYELLIDQIESVRGMAINLGGGRDFTLSIWSEFSEILEELSGRPLDVDFMDWRPGDQKVFYADINRAAELLDWRPTIRPKEGIRSLYDWVASNPELFAS